ncbi:MAG: pullulanase-type alpha-1,6-glucosidase [Candidatus Sericytochromatia bacterium]|nr:pullulanase-type alpha-1,6-glucosidase [Candidatus Sericytochromatia bacterium]
MRRSVPLLLRLALSLSPLIGPTTALAATPDQAAEAVAATAQPPVQALTMPQARGIWLRPEVIVHPEPGLRQLLSSPDASPPKANALAESFALTSAGQLKDHPELAQAYPHLSQYHAYKLPAMRPAAYQKLLRGQLLLQQSSAPTATEALQLAPLLDHLYAYDGPLGPSFDARLQPTLRLWAPTAQTVKLVLSDAALKSEEVHPMQPGPQGTWQISGPRDWRHRFYQYEVTVYAPWSGRIETHRVSDPYSTSLSLNSSHSQIVDLSDRWLQPKGWDQLLQQYPIQQSHPVDRVVYELHVRDFSSHDESVPARHRGKYTAFALADSDGLRHLRRLARSGLTHVHLLPAFDIATIEEDPRQQLQARIPEAAPDSEQQQAAIGQVRERDAFNWGYDPLHYGVPEGSYSTHPHGPQRIMEFRQLVQALARDGLGVIMDVVYNHTHAWGPAPKSVLDKIVPGYYYRLDATGQIQQSSCCPDTASEQYMMERLMIDTLVRWARDYKVTGFRFDLMGHHTVENLRKVRAALDQLTLEKDGVDGKNIQLYGEGWAFGSLHAIRPDTAMHQRNSAGSGIGTFNDRFRDAARGGNYDHGTRSDQGFISGLYLDPNQSPWNTDTPAEASAQLTQLLNYTDNLRLGLAGNLRDYRFINAQGMQISGAELPYRGQPPAGYTLSPAENVNYVSVHDNYSLWDQLAAKAPFETPQRGTASPAERASMQQLGLALVLLGQGMPFIHAGSEILRSKSGDGDSYDSGDWFNRLDWTYRDNNWGKGLPPAWRNAKEWDFWRPRLRQQALGARPPQILETLAQFERLLQLRKASPQLRLRSAEAIQQRVRFLNAERSPDQIPGLIAMQIAGTANEDALLVLLYAGPRPLRFDAGLQAGWQPHPLLQQSIDLAQQGKRYTLPPQPHARLEADGSLSLPPRSVSVFHLPANRP